MNIQAKVALDKEKHPELFCPVRRCLWKTSKLDHNAQTYSVRPDCPHGYCPRHQHLIPKGLVSGTLITLGFLAGVSARASAVDSPSSEQVREACSSLTHTVVVNVVGVLVLLAVIGLVRYAIYRAGKD